MTIPVLWIEGQRGYWDHGMLMHALAGTLYRTPRPYVYQEHEKDDIGDVGCVAVLAARGHTSEAQVKAHGEFVRRRPWALMLELSDEEGVGPWKQAVAPNSLVWVQMPNPDKGTGWHRPIVNGCPWNIRKVATEPPIVPLPNRPLLWSFSGQVTHPKRKQCAHILAPRTDGRLLPTDGFGKGLEYRPYLELMAASSIIPSPSGNATPDCFRTWEALEMGCLPVGDAHSQAHKYQGDYYSYAFRCQPSEIPFPRVNDWSELGGILNAYASNPLAIVQDANRAYAWWQAQKRQFVLNLEDDIRQLSGIEAPMAEGLRSKVTVVMSSSPIKGHPSTAMIAENIRKIRAYPELAECEVIICLDGMTPDSPCSAEAYEEYKRRLLWMCNWDPEFRGCLPMVFEGHHHQAEMTRQALERVRTPLVFMVEHDTYPYGDIPFTGIADALLGPDAPNLIRLSIFHDILPEHVALYPERRLVREIDGVPLIKTLDWSQRPHLASTEWYRRLLAEHVPVGTKVWIEHAMYGMAVAGPWERFRMMVYAPEGDMTRSAHTDGRRWEPPCE